VLQFLQAKRYLLLARTAAPAHYIPTYVHKAYVHMSSAYL